LLGGRPCNVVLVGPRQNPKGAAAVMPGEEGSGPQTQMLSAVLSLFHPRQVADILGMQERAFGACNLPPPGEVDGAP